MRELNNEEKIKKAMIEERNSLLDEDITPEINEPYDINNGFCLLFAENVEERLKEVVNVKISHLTLMNHNHYWITYNKKHYDAEAVNGVDNWEDLPFWSRLNIDLSSKKFKES